MTIIVRVTNTECWMGTSLPSISHACDRWVLCVLVLVQKRVPHRPNGQLSEYQLALRYRSSIRLIVNSLRLCTLLSYP